MPAKPLSRLLRKNPAKEFHNKNYRQRQIGLQVLLLRHTGHVPVSRNVKKEVLPPFLLNFFAFLALQSFSISQNPHPTFHNYLTLAFLCGIVPLLSPVRRAAVGRPPAINCQLIAQKAALFQRDL